MDGRGALDRAIKPQLRPAAPIVGPALTAFAYPADNLALAACLDVAQPGDVVVAATDGYRETAITGDLLAGMLRNAGVAALVTDGARSEEHTSELQSLMRISYAVFCLNKKKTKTID